MPCKFNMHNISNMSIAFISLSMASCKHNMPTCVHMPSCKHNMASWMRNNVDAGIMGQRVCYGSTYDFHCSLENFQTMSI